jgi:hypothetical protein
VSAAAINSPIDHTWSVRLIAIAGVVRSVNTAEIVERDAERDRRDMVCEVLAETVG